jgi:hypothetical protein
MTFIQALSNPTTRKLIELIEEVESDMGRYPNGNPTLEEMKADWIAELATLGYIY